MKSSSSFSPVLAGGRDNVGVSLSMRRYSIFPSVLLVLALCLDGTSGEIEWWIPPERLEDEDDENWPISVDLCGLKTDCNIVFTQPGCEPVTLDMYRPCSLARKPAPCIVLIHGGAWRVNTKEWFAPHAVYLARAGYVTVTINYRKLPKHSVDKCIEDAKSAILWIRKNSCSLGIDPNRIGALGGSAGGHLVAILATTPERECRVNAAVGFATADLGHPALAPFHQELELSTDRASELGAYSNISSDSAPLLLVHGTDDDAVPSRVSQDIHKRYKERGARSELRLLQGYHHVFYVTPKTFFESMDYARTFFDRELKEVN